MPWSSSCVGGVTVVLFSSVSLLVSSLSGCVSLFKQLTFSSTVIGCKLLVAMSASVLTNSFVLSFAGANSSSSIGSSSLHKTSLKGFSFSSVEFSMIEIAWGCLEIAHFSCLQSSCSQAKLYVKNVKRLKNQLLAING